MATGSAGKTARIERDNGLVERNVFQDTKKVSRWRGRFGVRVGPVQYFHTTSAVFVPEWRQVRRGFGGGFSRHEPAQHRRNQVFQERALAKNRISVE